MPAAALTRAGGGVRKSSSSGGGPCGTTGARLENLLNVLPAPSRNSKVTSPCGRALRRYGGAAGKLVDCLASAIQEFQSDFALRAGLEPVVDHCAACGVLANPRGGAAASAAATAAE